jgi:hypothetical protein
MIIRPYVFRLGVLKNQAQHLPVKCCHDKNLQAFNGSRKSRSDDDKG